MKELLFRVIQEEDGGYCASAVGEHICTQGDTWKELEEMVLNATMAYFYDPTPPDRIRLRLVHETVLTLDRIIQAQDA